MTAKLPNLSIWPSRTIQRRFGNIDISLQVIADFDTVLDYCAENYPDNTDMIPYYADLWPSAEALAGHLAEQHSDLANKRVLELGCGLGLPSIICAKLGSEITASDFHPHNRDNFLRNAAINGVADKTTYLQMDWSDPPPNIGKFDLVIGSDLLYEAKQIDSLAKAIPRLLKPQGTFILADPGRDHIQAATDAIAHYTPTITIIDNIFIITFMRE